jgi:hypothetical protein
MHGKPCGSTRGSFHPSSSPGEEGCPRSEDWTPGPYFPGGADVAVAASFAFFAARSFTSATIF